jgi:omega-amidase
MTRDTLFRMAGEDAHYDMGTERKVFEWKGWKIMPQICYDLRFPVWTRNRVENDKLEYDLIFYVASWPSPRISAWDILLKARAIENLSYCIGVNRIGQDGNGSLIQAILQFIISKGKLWYFLTIKKKSYSSILTFKTY